MEGKKRYVAIVLFLLIGLTLFTFANPVEEEKGSKGNGSNGSEVTDKTDDTTDGTLGTVEEQNQNPTQVQNQVADTSYADALAAVVRAEGSLEELDVETARDLIEQVTNQNQKDELTERVDIVEEAIEAIKLVEELEKMVEEAAKRDDILESIDYRTDNEIIQLVDALRNEDVQESLQNRLEILSRILDDNSAPTYEGVENNETTNKDVSLYYSDIDEETETENEVTVKVTLDGEEIDYTVPFTEEGTYVVTLTDEAFNETTVTFTIDKTAPRRVYSTVRVNKTEYAENGTKYYYVKNGDSFVFAISFTEELAETPVVTIAGREVEMKLNEKVLENENKVLYEGTFAIAKNEKELQQGTLEIKVSNVKDAAGNEATDETVTDQTRTSNGRTVIYDCKNPVVTGVNNNYHYNAPITIKAVDYIVHNVSPIEKATIDGEPYELGTEYGVEGTHLFVAYDRAGNRLGVNFTIDYTAPSITGVDEAKATNKNEIVYVSDKNLSKVTINGTEYTEKDFTVENGMVKFQKKVTHEGTHTVVAIDKAGNQTTKTFEIDKTAPSVTGVDETKPTNKNEIVYVSDKNLVKVTINGTEYIEKDFTVENGVVKFQKKVTHEGTHTVVATDEAGNQTTKTFVIDKTANRVTQSFINGDVYEGKVYYIKNGGSIKFSIGFREKLGSDATIKIGGKEVTLTYEKYVKATNSHMYNGTLTIDENESELVEGQLEFTIENITDEAGNKGFYYQTNGKKVLETITTEVTTNGKSLIYDRTAPTLKVKEESVGTDPYYSEISFKLHDSLKIDYFTVNGTKIDRTNAPWSDANYQNIKSALVEGENVVVLYDVAGNTTTKTFYMDWTPATINLTGTAGLNKNEYRVESGTKVTLEDVLATVTDNYDKTVQIKPYEANLLISNVASENTYGYDFTNGFDTAYVGRYNIYYEYTDAAGNKSTVCMLLVMKDTTAPTVKVDVRKDKGITDIVASDVTKLSFEIYKEGKKVHSFNSGVNYKRFSIDWLGDGVYTVVAIDEGGNKTSVQTTIDHTVPVANYVEIKGITTTPGYAKVGDEVWVGLITNEEMATLPTIKINGVVAEKIQEEKNSAGHKYYAKVIMTQEMAEGEIKFTIEGYKDAFDNEGVALSNKDLNLGLDKIIFDKTAPTLTAKEDSVGTAPYYSAISFSLSDNNAITYFELNGEKHDRTDAIWSDANYDNIKASLVAGPNTIVLYDIAGNKSEKTFYMDWTAPTVEVKNWIGNNPYSGASFKLKDNYAIDYFVLNGKSFDRTNAPSSDANYQNIKGALVDGENTLVLYDVAGNSTTYTFTLERIAPTITVADGTVGTGPYSKLNLKLYDASGIASVVINGNQLPHTGYYVDINDGHAYTFKEGNNTVVVTDNAGNVTTQTFVVDRVPVATTSSTSQRIDETDSRYVDTGNAFANAFFNMISTYTIKVNEPVKITLVEVYDGTYGGTIKGNATNMYGLTTNADAEGYATEFTISYNNALWFDIETYVKPNWTKITFEDKGGNSILVEDAEALLYRK